jgi:CDP-diacylglycerol--serine O-phosphatidyltransferase
VRGRLRSRRLSGSGGFAGGLERASLGGGRRGPLRQKMRGRGIFLLPSLLTTGNLFCGFFAMLLTVEDRYFEASLAIFVAMVMDMLDGRVARLMKATSQFGVEFDSLADVVSFCVAPAFLVYSFALSGLGRPAWFAAFLFVICGALRLARFNVYTGVTDRRFFVGLPTPAGAGVLVSTVLLLYREEAPRWVLVAIAVGTYLTALLMVSTFRYWSFKEIDFARRRPVQTLLVVVLAVMIVATNYELFPFLLFGIYALSGPARWLVMGRATAAPHGELGTKEPS